MRRTLLVAAAASMDRLRRLGPGLCLCAVAAMAAAFLAGQYGGPVMLYALLLGAGLHAPASTAPSAPGVDCATSTLLKVGVALLGARVTVADFTGLGFQPLLLVCSGVIATVLVGCAIGRWLRLGTDTAVLTAGAVAVCGVSAALAIAAALPTGRRDDSRTLTAVIGVTALSTVAMIFYPALAQALGFEGRVAGVFLGATIHDVAHVVAASHALGDPGTVDAATMVKLLRVTMLVPIVVAVAFLFGRGSMDASAARGLPLPPAFLVSYICIMLVNSLGWLTTEITTAMNAISSAFIVTAVAGLGARSSLGEFARIGWRPAAALTAQTAFLVAYVATGLRVICATTACN